MVLLLTYVFFIFDCEWKYNVISNILLQGLKQWVSVLIVILLEQQLSTCDLQTAEIHGGLPGGSRARRIFKDKIRATQKYICFPLFQL